jgi:adenine phosphoribosyltransferase
MHRFQIAAGTVIFAGVVVGVLELVKILKEKRKKIDAPRPLPDTQDTSLASSTTPKPSESLHPCVVLSSNEKDLVLRLTSMEIPCVDSASGAANSIPTIQVQSCKDMTLEASAAYAALYWLRTSRKDPPKDLSGLVPLHNTQLRGGLPFVNTMALLRVPQVMTSIVQFMSQRVKALNATAVVAFEARAMAFGAIVAAACNLSFVSVRKVKENLAGTHLVSETVEGGMSYRACNTLVIDADAFVNDNVLIVDDVVSSGTTIASLIRLIDSCGSAKVVGVAAVVELLQWNSDAQEYVAPANRPSGFTSMLQIKASPHPLCGIHPVTTM